MIAKDLTLLTCELNKEEAVGSNNDTGVSNWRYGAKFGTS